MLRHEFEGLGTRGRMFAHAALAIEFVALVEKILVVAFADQFIEFGFGEALFVQVAGIERNFQFEQKSFCFAAGSAGGFLVESDFGGHGVDFLLESINKRSASKIRQESFQC